ncbi:MAG: histidine phosphatase family protein [Actinomycetota bacterium]
MLTVLGIRHGEVHNPTNVIYSGLPGFVLSETGRAQAAAVAEALEGVPIAALHASPLDRAIETATFIAEVTGTEVTPDDRLHEWRHWEQWAGLTWEELATTSKESFDRYVNDPGSVTQGESLAELAGRMEAWLSDVEREHRDGLVIGVSHLEPLRAILLRRLGRPANDLFALDIRQCDVVRLLPDVSAEPVPLAELRAAL